MPGLSRQTAFKVHDWGAGLSLRKSFPEKRAEHILVTKTKENGRMGGCETVGPIVSLHEGADGGGGLALFIGRVSGSPVPERSSLIPPP